MAENKTKHTDASVEAFLDRVDDERKRDDSRELIRLMSKLTGEEPKMYGPSIVGFGTYHYKYASGHEGDACLAGFSPRKAAITVYLTPGFDEDEPVLMSKLGKYKATKGCLYVKKLEDIDMKVLEQLIKKTIAHVKKTYPTK